MQAYRMLSLERTDEIPHLNSLAGKWYRYVIGNDITMITGYRCGSLSAVKQYVHHNIKRLNEKYNIQPSREKFNKPLFKPCHLFEPGLPS